MNENKKVMPERFYSLDNNMSIDKIIQAQINKEMIVGKVVLWDSRTKSLKVFLGNDLYGFLPIDNASIYPTLLPDGKLTASIRSTIGKTICVLVTNVDITASTSPFIQLSRKEIMLDTFNLLSNSIGKEIECCVTSFSSYGVFVDAGNGLSGLIHFTELCTSRVRNFSELGFKEGSKIVAKLISVNNNFQIGLNYKDTFENLAYILNSGDLIEATLLEPLNKDGYFAYLNPNTTALVDVPRDVSCDYGDKVVARVKGTRTSEPDKLRLTFVSFVD